MSAAAPLPRILVADDSRVTRQIVSHVLESGGFTIVTACDGLEAEHISRQPDTPRIFLLDGEMPGLSGVELARRLRGNPVHERSYIVLVTGNDSDEALIEGLGAGADDYVKKPFRGRELLARARAGARVVQLQIELSVRMSELESALSEVKTLRGLVPICMHCHRIRSESQEWQRLERYIEAHSDASFSHSICEACLELHYPKDAA